MAMTVQGHQPLLGRGSLKTAFWVAGVAAAGGSLSSLVLSFNKGVIAAGGLAATAIALTVYGTVADHLASRRRAASVAELDSLIAQSEQIQRDKFVELHAS